MPCTCSVLFLPHLIHLQCWQPSQPSLSHSLSPTLAQLWELTTEPHWPNVIACQPLFIVYTRFRCFCVCNYLPHGFLWLHFIPRCWLLRFLMEIWLGTTTLCWLLLGKKPAFQSKFTASLLALLLCPNWVLLQSQYGLLHYAILTSQAGLVIFFSTYLI